MPVLVAGDPERMHTDQVKEAGGILYHDNVIAAMVSMTVRMQGNPLLRLFYCVYRINLQ